MTLTSGTRTTLGAVGGFLAGAGALGVWLWGKVDAADERQAVRLEKIEAAVTVSSRELVAISHRLDLFELRVSESVSHALDRRDWELWKERLRSANQQKITVPD